MKWNCKNQQTRPKATGCGILRTFLALQISRAAHRTSPPNSPGRPHAPALGPSLDYHQAHLLLLHFLFCVHQAPRYLPTFFYFSSKKKFLRIYILQFANNFFFISLFVDSLIQYCRLFVFIRFCGVLNVKYRIMGLCNKIKISIIKTVQSQPFEINNFRGNTLKQRLKF